MKLLYYSLLIFIFYSNAYSQKIKKGTFYLTWGYNREQYSNSTINFKNNSKISGNYDFTIHNATAHDKKGGDTDNFWHTGATIPQYSCAIGYLFNNKRNWGLEISWDHYKYIVTDYQTARVTGQIEGKQIDTIMQIDPDFMHLQHTNGNNYLMANIVKKSSIIKKPYFELSGISKFGLGILYSYTISTVLNSHDPGHFRNHGYVTALSTGLRFDFARYFFLQVGVQGAFANYLSTELGSDRKGRAKHSFFSFGELAFFGINIPLQNNFKLRNP